MGYPRTNADTRGSHRWRLLPVLPRHDSACRAVLLHRATGAAAKRPVIATLRSVTMRGLSRACLSSARPDVLRARLRRAAGLGVSGHTPSPRTVDRRISSHRWGLRPVVPPRDTPGNVLHWATGAAAKRPVTANTPERDDERPVLRVPLIGTPRRVASAAPPRRRSPASGCGTPSPGIAIRDIRVRPRMDPRRQSARYGVRPESQRAVTHDRDPVHLAGGWPRNSLQYPAARFTAAPRNNRPTVPDGE